MRELLFTSNPEVLKENISATILFHESVYHKTSDGIPFIELLNKLGIIPGIKVDEGTVPLFGTYDETTVQGLRKRRNISESFRGLFVLNAIKMLFSVLAACFIYNHCP